MTLLIAFLTFVMVLTCLFLILLVLVQLPKKEAGAGLAFGGGATDALFGAGSGNALTKMTKYAASVFLGLALVLTFLNTQRHQSSSVNVNRALSGRSTAPGAVAPATVPNQQPATQPNTVQPVQNPASGPLQLTPQPTQEGAAPAAPTVTPQAGQTPAPAQPQAGQTAPAQNPAPTPAPAQPQP